MQRRKYAVYAAVLAAGILAAGDLQAGGGVSGKPRLPIQVTVLPVQAGVSLDAVRPGELVDLAVTAVAMQDVDEVQFHIRTESGAELIAGVRQLSAQAAKGEKSVQRITVQAPKKGVGRLVVDVTFLKNGGAVVGRRVQYDIGSGDGATKEQPKFRKSKDSKGRDIIEYE